MRSSARVYNWSHALYESGYVGHGRPGFGGEIDASGAESESTARDQSALGESKAVEKSGMKKETGPESRSTLRPIIQHRTPSSLTASIHSLANLAMRFKGILSIRRITYGRPAAS